MHSICGDTIGVGRAVQCDRQGPERGQAVQRISRHEPLGKIERGRVPRREPQARSPKTVQAMVLARYGMEYLRLRDVAKAHLRKMHW